MAERVHRFYCPRCDRFLYGETVFELAKGVNFHAASMHPSDFSNWTPINILASSHYSPPSNYTIPQYTDALESNHHRAKQFVVAPSDPVITDADRQMLKEGHVVWD